MGMKSNGTLRNDALIEWKRKSGLRNNQIAMLWGCTEAYVSYLLNGQMFPSRKMALRIHEATRVPLEQIMFPHMSRDRRRMAS